MSRAVTRRGRVAAPRTDRAWAIVLLGALPLGGCQLLQELASRAAKPSAEVVGVRFEDLDLESLTLGFDVRVANPYALPLPVGTLGYRLASAGTELLSGRADPGAAVPAHGERTVAVPMTVRFSDLLRVLSGVRPGAVIPYEATLDVNVDPPGEGAPIAFPLTRSGELPVPAPPQVELTALRWERLSLKEAAAQLELRVLNPNEFGFDLERLDYALSLGGTEVARAGLSAATAVAAGGSGALTVPVSFAPADLGLAFFNVLTGDGAAYRLAGTLHAETPFGPLELPYARSGQASFTR